MNAFLMEKFQIKAVNVPYDANTPITEARIKLAEGYRCAVVLNMGDSTSAVVTVVLTQHDAASAGTSKALSVDNPYYHKKAGTTYFTKVSPSVAASSYDIASIFADDEGIVVFEVEASQLDINNGFYWFSVDIADTTAAKIISGLYIMAAKHMPAYDLVV